MGPYLDWEETWRADTRLTYGDRGSVSLGNQTQMMQDYIREAIPRFTADACFTQFIYPPQIRYTKQSAILLDLAREMDLLNVYERIWNDPQYGSDLMYMVSARLLVLELAVLTALFQAENRISHLRYHVKMAAYDNIVSEFNLWPPTNPKEPANPKGSADSKERAVFIKQLLKNLAFIYSMDSDVSLSWSALCTPVSLM